jgi:site-specific recombinase XerD
MLPHVGDFLLSLESTNYSPETIYNYERDLNVFSNFLEEADIKFNEIDRRVIPRYKAYLASPDRKTASQEVQGGKQLDSRSINRMLSALRAYLHYLIDTDRFCPPPPEAVKLTKADTKHPQVAELNDLLRLIEAPSSLESNPNVALRNRAMLEILFATGMRISELCNLERNQIDGSKGILITGKGRKQRFVYMTRRAMHYLSLYLTTRRDNCPALFIPYAGRNVANPGKTISTNYLQERIKRYREKLKINIPTSADSLRRGFATYLIEEGANPAPVQILLGHETLRDTTRYVHGSDEHAQESPNERDPLDAYS